MLQRPDTRFVAVDTLVRIRQIGSDSNNYDETYVEAAALKEFADKHNVSLACATHTRKASVEDFLHGVIGSTGQVGGADTIWRLSRVRGEGRAVLEVTGREVADQKLALAFDANVGSWTLTGDATDMQPTEERQAIVDLLTAAPGPMGPAEVADSLGRDRTATRQLMSRMAEAEAPAIVRASYGKYTVRGCHTSHCHTWRAPCH